MFPRKSFPMFQSYFEHTREETGDYGEYDREKLISVEGTSPKVKEKALRVIGMLQKQYKDEQQQKRGNKRGN